MPRKSDATKPLAKAGRTSTIKRMTLNETRAAAYCADKAIQMAAARARTKHQRSKLPPRALLARVEAASCRLRKQASRRHQNLLVSIRLLELIQEVATENARRCAELRRDIDQHHRLLSAAQLRHQQLGAVLCRYAQEHASRQRELSNVVASLHGTTRQKPSWWQEIVERRTWHAWIARRRALQQLIEEKRQQRDIDAAKSHKISAEQATVAYSMADTEAFIVDQENKLAYLLRLRYDTDHRNAARAGSREAFEARGIPQGGDFRRGALALSNAVENFHRLESVLASAHQAHHARSLESGLQVQAVLTLAKSVRRGLVVN